MYDFFFEKNEKEYRFLQPFFLVLLVRSDCLDHLGNYTHVSLVIYRRSHLLNRPFFPFTCIFIMIIKPLFFSFGLNWSRLLSHQNIFHPFSLLNRLMKIKLWDLIYKPLSFYQCCSHLFQACSLIVLPQLHFRKWTLLYFPPKSKLGS